MNRVLIFTGGRLGAWALAHLRPDDFLIGADRGGAYLAEHGIRMHVALGDFDSVSPAQLDAIRAACDRFEASDPVMKDYSDTELAFQEALLHKPAEIVLLGALGTRFDHSLANVHLLLTAKRSGVRCRLIDEHNEITLTDSSLAVTNADNRYTYVSLLPLSEEVTGVTLEGFVYPLNDATLRIGQSLAVSNRLAESRGFIHIRSGLLLVIQSKDE